MLSTYLANPAIAAGVISGILFGCLTVFEMDRTIRSRTFVLIDAVVSPLCMALIKILALLAAAFLSLAAVMAVWLPISARPVSYTHLDVYKRQVLNIHHFEPSCYPNSSDKS